MSLHIGAKKGEIADTVLLPGDPLRAKFIAGHFLEGTSRYNEVRGMFGYTGVYKGQRVSVQGTGMGVPSISIYVHELLAEYDVKTVMRVGTCGAIQTDIELREVILAMSACSDSNVNNLRFPGGGFAPTADYALLRKADKIARAKSLHTRIGSVFTTDSFYHDDPDYWKKWADYGVLAIEMESAALYTIAAKFEAKALSILTVSDCLPTNQASTSEEREKTFGQMAELALDVALDQ